MNKIFATVSLNSILVYDPCLEGLEDFKAKFEHLDPDAPVPLISCLSSNSAMDTIWALQAVHQDISAILPMLAADFAESVLHLFEEKFPNDNRPRVAIELARQGKNNYDYQRTARVSADAKAAADAAYDAAKAASYPAHVTRSPAIPRSTNWTLAAYATYAAASLSAAAALSAAEPIKHEEILRKYFSETPTE